ncbi:MAG: adenylosuccinate lyase [Planctomycetota bacterium]|nr:adenylosuccinate lyase [Planctomycetota bacterium]
MEKYESPLASRYASANMQRIFSNSYRYGLWRRLWTELAESQHELGIRVSSEQVRQMREHLDDIDFEAVARYEAETRHEVMAHIRAFGDVAPDAMPIIHLGATSAFVMDNSDLLQARNALKLVEKQIQKVLHALAGRARRYRSLAVLGYTHFQPAQITTLGKRVSLWMQDLHMDLKGVRSLIRDMPFLGMKGATGTQASVLALCDGDGEKVRKLDERIGRKLGFAKVLTVSGQTYPRKIDSLVYRVLCGVAESASKFAHDIRLLQHTGELMEPFRGKQVGSSAMPYKRNPMASERICGLSRFLISLGINGPLTAGTQWLERSLDDSSNKRLAMPQAFLTADAILHHVYNIARGFEVVEPVIRSVLAKKLPFIATENILMAAVRAGGDRQNLHERIREHSMLANERLQQGAGDNDLLSRLMRDEQFASIRDKLEKPLDPNDFVGLAPQQVDRFLEEIANDLGEESGEDPWESEISV